MLQKMKKMHDEFIVKTAKRQRTVVEVEYLDESITTTPILEKTSIDGLESIYEESHDSGDFVPCSGSDRFDILWNPKSKRTEKMVNAMVCGAIMITHPYLTGVFESVRNWKNIPRWFQDEDFIRKTKNWQENKEHLRDVAFCVDNSTEIGVLVLLAQCFEIDISYFNLGLLQQYDGLVVVICSDFLRVFADKSRTKDVTREFLKFRLSESDFKTLCSKKEVVMVKNWKELMKGIYDDFSKSTVFTKGDNVRIEMDLPKNECRVSQVTALASALDLTMLSSSGIADLTSPRDDWTDVIDDLIPDLSKKRKRVEFNEKTDVLEYVVDDEKIVCVGCAKVFHVVSDLVQRMYPISCAACRRKGQKVQAIERNLERKAEREILSKMAQ